MTWILTALGLVKKVPWQVWAIIGVAVAFLWYGEYREDKGYAKCRAEIVQATKKVNEDLRTKEKELFKLRQEFSDQQVVFQGQLKGARDDAAKMREAWEKAVADAEAKGEPPPTAIVCVPNSISSRLRDVGKR